MTDVRRNAAAVATLFVANGLIVGVFGGSLPGYRDLLGLGDGRVVGVLVTAGLAAIVSMQVSGRVADRRGVRGPCFVGGATMVVGTWVMAAAPDQLGGYPGLLAGAAVFGLGNGALDVAMNAAGVHVERLRGRPIMSRLHACFSIGNFAGAGVVVGLGHLDARLPVLAGGLVAAALMATAWTSTPRTDPVVHRDGSGVRTKVPLLAWLLAAMAICFGLTEGTAVDWSSIHVTDVAHVSASQGAFGLAAVSGFMVVIRLFGDVAVHRLGRRTVVRGGAACAMLGYLLTAFTSPLPVILVGWALVGFGVGLIAPQIYGLAGRVGGGRVLALVVSFGYAAFLVGPAVIGQIAVATGTVTRPGIQNAMLLPLLTAIGLIVMASRMPSDADATAGASAAAADAASRTP